MNSQSGVRLIGFFYDRNWPNTINFGIRVRLLKVSAE